MTSARRWSPACSARRKPDLDALAELLRDAPEYGEDIAQLRRLAGLAVPSDDEIREAFEALRVAERAHADAAGTDAKRATDVAALLRRALEVRDGEDCPVCGTPGVLDDAWARTPPSRPSRWSSRPRR